MQALTHVCMGACTQVSVCRDDACVRECATEQLGVSEWELQSPQPSASHITRACGGPANRGTRGANCVHTYLNPGWRGSA